MPTKSSQITLLGVISWRLYAASPAHSVLGFIPHQKCAIFRSNSGSSGECRLIGNLKFSRHGIVRVFQLQLQLIGMLMFQFRNGLAIGLFAGGFAVSLLCTGGIILKYAREEINKVLFGPENIKNATSKKPVASIL